MATRRPGRRSPDVTICIPTYMAEGFIGSTLRLAAGQTHRRIRILVSVDASTDATVDVCRDYANRDERIAVFEQPERLGWAGNVNFLLDRVDTPYYLLYFHDDVLLPQCTESLLGALRDSDAVMAYCDVGYFGPTNFVSVGRPYQGSAAARLMAFLLAPNRGSPLRGLTRSAVLESVRLPTDAVDGLWANEPYLLQLLAAGSALHVPEVLYLRWAQRAGGLTESWKELPPEQLLEGWKRNIAGFVRLVESVSADAAEARALRYAVMINTFPRVVRPAEDRLGVHLFDKAGELHPSFPDLAEPPPPLDMFVAEVEQWARQRHGRLLRTERARRL